jgi:hypothetical protein
VWLTVAVDGEEENFCGRLLALLLSPVDELRFCMYAKTEK